MEPFENIRPFLDYKRVKDSIRPVELEKEGKEYIYRDCPYFDLGSKVRLFMVSDGMLELFVTDTMLKVWNIDKEDFLKTKSKAG